MAMMMVMMMVVMAIMMIIMMMIMMMNKTTYFLPVFQLILSISDNKELRISTRKICCYDCYYCLLLSCPM